MRDLCELESELELIAEELSRTSNGNGTVDVLAVARALGVGVRLERGPLTHRQRGRLVAEGKRAAIVLRRTDGENWDWRPLSPRERFTLAHEIAHVVVDTRWTGELSAKRDYWRMEEICNRFAERLLVPDRMIPGVVDVPLLWTAEDFMDSVIRVRAAAYVSLEVTARRLLRTAARASLAAEVVLGIARRGRIGTLHWLIGTDKFESRRRILLTSDPLSELTSLRGSLRVHEKANLVVADIPLSVLGTHSGYFLTGVLHSSATRSLLASDEIHKRGLRISARLTS